MATLNASNKQTLLDLAAEIGPEGDLLKMAMVLAQTNEILLDAPWIQANGPTYHEILQSLSLPTGNWRMINRGVPVEAAHGVKVTEAIGMLESFARTDKKLVDIAPNPTEFRSTKALQFLEGMNQTFAETLIYGNADASPEEITGLVPRLNDTNLTNVISAGSTSTAGDLTSVYVVVWGDGKVYLTYPRDAVGFGVTHQDNGELTLEDDDGNVYRGYEDHFQLDVGLVVEDPRCIGRYCNIETSGSTNTFDPDHLITILNKMPSRAAGGAIYCGTTVFTQLDILAKDKTNVIWGPEDAFGRPVMYFRGIPVRQVDQILDTEDLVTA